MRWLYAPIVLATAALGCAQAEPAPEHAAIGLDDTPPEAAGPSREPLPSEAECRECHPEVAAQWDRSRHHAAFSNPDFQRSLAREPEDFCRNCHAPGLARVQPLTATERAEAEALGVGCLDCHAGEGTLLAGPNANLAAAPHPLAAVQDFATHSCARCHEFDFPPNSRRPPGSMMQLTMREHRASAPAVRSCADCHLPAGDHSLAVASVRARSFSQGARCATDGDNRRRAI